MSDPSKPSSRVGGIIGVVVSLVICSLIGVCLFTDLPAKWGIFNKPVAQSEDHDDHDHDDHEGHNHDVHNHDVHNHDEHDDHDHEGHDHEADGQESTDGFSESFTLPPMLDDDDVIDVDQIPTSEDHVVHDDNAPHDDHAGHDHAPHDDHAGHDHAAHDEHGHDEHNHDDHAAHDGHSEENSITLSVQARKNLGLKIQPVKLSTFTRYIDVPGVVTDWPGKTHIDVTSPLTGVINSIGITRGELVSNGRALFTLRLTHQDLVKTQESFLTELGQLDVEDREIKRLTKITKSGAVAGKTLINRKYERDRLAAALNAARQSLLLHGLTETQICHIEKHRELIREVVVSAPEQHEDDSLHHDALSHHGESGQIHLATHNHGEAGHPAHVKSEFLVTELDVNRGQSVMAGKRLTRLSDYSNVLIEGRAFQRDSDVLRKAALTKIPLQAVFDSSAETPVVVGGLEIVNIGNEIDRDSRALPFYVSLTNVIERNEVLGGKNFASWQYKPGARLHIRIPTSQLNDKIVVPSGAVAQDGAERYVFVQNDGHFDRVTVTIVAEDSLQVAIAKDGQLKPGQSIAISGAHNLQMAMKNKSGPAIDPHHGHSH